MTGKYLTYLTAAMALTIMAAGCAVRPHAPIPVGLTAEHALAALAARQETIHDFSARARTTFVENGVPQNATLMLRYLSPGRCRVYIKGFVGIDMARLTVLGDSMTVYVPPENYYFTLPRSSRYAVPLAPGMEVGFELIERLFTTVVPVAGEQSGYTASLAETTGTAVLTLARNGETHLLTLAGPDLLVMNEEYYIGDTRIWRKTIDSYTDVNGIPFPSSVTVEYENGSLSLSYTDIELNVGFTEESLSFTIPPSAERIVVGPPY